MELLKHRVDPEWAANLEISGERARCRWCVERIGLRELEQLLPEERQLLVSVRLVERDEVGKRMHPQPDSAGQVSIEVALEIEDEDDDLRVARVDFVDRGDVGGVDDDRSCISHRSDGSLEDGVGLVAGACDATARDANARAPEAVRVEELHVVGEDLAASGACRGIARIWQLTRDGAEHGGRVRDGARVRADGVLIVRDGHDAGTARKPNCRLDADDAINRSRAHDAAVRLGAEGDSCEVRRGRGARARARAAGVAVDCVGVVGLSATPGPAARRVDGAEVRPLAQVGLAEDDSAGGTKLGGHRGILEWGGADQGKRTGCRLHPIGGINVVFEQDWYPV